MVSTGTFGCYGKLPCAGDFIRRDLSHEFVRSWDVWLQELLLAGREELGSRWQECYFGAPIWRFAVSPGLCGPQGAVGIVMPSVDRVGRQFPICIAAEIEAPAWAAFRAAEPVFSRLEDIALSMLDDSANIDGLETALAGLSALHADAIPASRPVGDTVSLVSAMTVQDILASRGATCMGSVWVAVIGDRNRVLVSPDMPNGSAEAAAIFDLDARNWAENAMSAEGVPG